MIKVSKVSTEAEAEALVLRLSRSRYVCRAFQDHILCERPINEIETYKVVILYGEK